MATRPDPAGERDGPALLPLREAVIVAQLRLFPEPSDWHPKLLATIAIALSDLMPIYATCSGGAVLRELTEAEILAGCFMRNAVVSFRDLERAIAALRFDSPEAARATLTLRPKAGGRERLR